MKNKNWVKYTIIYLVYVLIIWGLTYLITALISNNGIYPSGSDTMYHVYRGQYVYESICKADFFPFKKHVASVAESWDSVFFQVLGKISGVVVFYGIGEERNLVVVFEDAFFF